MVACFYFVAGDDTINADLLFDVYELPFWHSYRNRNAVIRLSKKNSK